MDPDSFDLLFGKTLLINDLATEAQIRECVVLQSDRAADGESPFLGDLMVEKSFCSREDVDAVLRAQYKQELLRDDLDFKKEALARGWIGETVLEEALSHQRDCSVNEPSIQRLSDALIDRGHLSLHQALLILLHIKHQKRLEQSSPPPQPSSPDTSPIEEGTHLEGQVFDGYEIQSHIAAGGMGVVYKGEQLSLNREVAIKILSHRLSSNTKSIYQFIREAHAAARLSHGHIIRIFDLGQYRGLYYMVMEYVSGTNLRQRIEEQGPIPPIQAIHYTLQALSALQAGYAEGVVHKDIKPENLLVDEHGQIKVADYGLARIEDYLETEKKPSISGTVQYMSPEQVNGEDLDIQTDIYSLGASLFEMLTGEPPFRATTSMGVALMHVRQPLRPLEELPVPVLPDLYRVVEGMMAKARPERYAIPSDAETDLRKVLAQLENPQTPQPAKKKTSPERKSSSIRRRKRPRRR
ncbi:MAG: protein kinase [Planctomycetota bacterium]|jgi:serine/threonine protein kinase|nr:protein kinase [Planctomycetota bacterium]